MEALSDALRLELRQWKIPVVHVDPGATDTAIFGKTLAALDDLEPNCSEPEAYQRTGADRGDAEGGREDGCRHGPALELAKAIAKGLTADKPKSRYHAGKGAEEAIVLARVPRTASRTGRSPARWARRSR